MAKTEQIPPPLYRADYLKLCVEGRGRYGGVDRRGPHPAGISIRDLAKQLKLSTGTIQSALRGDCSKIETLKVLADFFRIPWLMLFDLNVELEFDDAGKLVGPKNTGDRSNKFNKRNRKR